MISFTESDLNSQATWAGAENRMAGKTIRDTTFSEQLIQELLPK